MIIDMSQAPYNCVADGVTDCSNAFDTAINVLKNSSFTFGQLGSPSYGGSIPGGHGIIYWPTVKNSDGFSRPYRLSRSHKLYSNMTIKGDGQTSCLMFDAGVSGLIFDSLYNQSQERLHIENIQIAGRAIRPAGYSGSYHQYFADHGRPPGVGDIGIHLQGGSQISIKDCVIGGFDRCLVVQGAELAHVDGCIFSTWNAEAFTPGRVGVHLALVRDANGNPVAGGITNQNSFRDCQFQTEIPIWSEDGAANLFESCNFNAPFEMLRCEGTQGLTIKSCTCEGVQSNTMIRCGKPGGLQSGGIIAWQKLSIEDCVLTVGGNQKPLLLFVEAGYAGFNTSFKGTVILGNRKNANGLDMGIIEGAWTPVPTWPNYHLVNLNGGWIPPVAYDGAPVEKIVGEYYPVNNNGIVTWQQHPEGMWASRPYGIPWENGIVKQVG
jgi:hypothetical protein